MSGGSGSQGHLSSGPFCLARRFPKRYGLLRQQGVKETKSGNGVANMGGAAAGNTADGTGVEKLPSYHFHGDIISRIPGATKLAYSAMTACQLFRYGSTVYCFKYHAEADEPLIEIMRRNNRVASDVERIIKQSLAYLPEFELRCGLMLDRWLDLARRLLLAIQ
jgi:hypothetical protein